MHVCKIYGRLGPNFVFGDQNLNLVASLTTSVIEVDD
jgi:hypothetical protein